jgi:hypothetical protein
MEGVSNMLKVLNAARAVELHVFYAMHHRYRAGDYDALVGGLHHQYVRI